MYFVTFNWFGIYQMKNEITYQIPQDKIKEFLKLDNQKFQELKKQVGISTVEPLGFNNLKALVSFSSKLGAIVPGVNEFDLKPFEVNEKDISNHFLQDIPEPKKIKIYKEKKTKVTKPKVEKLDPIKKTIVKRGNGRVKRTFTPEEDKKILDYYNSDYYKYRKVEKGKKAYSSRELAADLNIKDKKIIRQRASELGFTNFVVPKIGNEYTDEELEILKINVGKITTKKIQQLLKEKGFQKSIVSINVKITRLNLSLKLDGTGDFTLTLLSKALGVDTHMITDNKNLMLEVNPEKTNKEWIFSREKLKQYIIKNPYHLNFGKIDNKFLVELLAGEK